MIRGSLFAKLFLWFWLVMLIIGAAFLVTERYWMSLERLPSLDELEEYAAEIQRLHAEDGHGAVAGYLRSLSRQSELRYILLRPDGRGGPYLRRFPDGLREELLSNVADMERGSGRVEGWQYVVVPMELTGRGGGPYLLAALVPPRGFGELPGWLRLLIAMAVTAGLSGLLASHLSRRLRQMRQASQRLAGGELDVRVPDPGPGGDEISALGRDFNTMADRLQQLLESRNQLLSDVSHELRSPLARMQVALELARRKVGDEAGDTLDRMERDIHRLDELIGEVLRLARLERGSTGLQMWPQDLAELLRQSCEDAAFEAEHGRRAVRWQPFPAMPVLGDASLLRSALDNVLRNAIRYSPEAGAVTVEAEVSGRIARIAVTDQGAGVPEEQLGRIFEPFVRVSSARDRETGGHGLGLAIVRRAVDAHGGRVWAENARSGGLRVVLELPLSQQPDDRS